MRDRDTQQKFLVETCDVRGHIVQLDETWREAVARVDYPAPIRQVLGQAFAAAALLASTIKFDGKLTVQVRGEGAVHLLVVQVTNEGSLRGLARWSREPEESSLSGLFGKEARMIITVEADRQAQPYQGIVPLQGEDLAEALQGYFQTSEQLPTRLFLSVSGQSAAGVLIQKLPQEHGQSTDADGWDRASALCETLGQDELCNESAQTLLHRLFHEEQVRVYEPEPVRFHCSCSRERTDNMLIGLGQQEVEDILAEQGKVEINCEFCDSQYLYDSVDVAALFKGVSSPGSSSDDDTGQLTRH